METMSVKGDASHFKVEPKSSRSRAKVSFSEEVIDKDQTGDGNSVDVEEEQGVFLGPLLGRMTLSSASEDSTAGENIIDNGSRRVVSNLTCSFSSNDSIESQYSKADIVEFDNLIIRMGLLKCGYRYQLLVPVPNHWSHSEENGMNQGEASSSSCHSGVITMVRVSEKSIDGDLRGDVIEKGHNGARESGDRANSSPSCHYFVSVTLSATRRGPFRGRFALEVIVDSKSRYTKADTIQSQGVHSTEPCDTDTSIDKILDSNRNGFVKCNMSVQVDATIMGKDMGTPKLRNGVICLGKIVGYDSDDDTEWQGFD